MSLIYPGIALLARPDVPSSALTVARSGPATCINAVGCVVPVDVNTLRHDFHPVTGIYRGWLIEEARTNLIRQSADLQAAPWQTEAASVSANAATGPDGQTSADALIESTAASPHAVYQEGLIYVGGQTYTLSVFARSHGRGRLQLVLPSPAFGTVHSAIFDLTTGTIGPLEGTVTTRMEAFADDWYRCAVTATAATGATTSAHLRLRDSGGVSDYAGDGTSGVLLWGAQLEAGAFASSYIPTGTASETRTADAASLTLTSQTFTTRGGTLVAQGAVGAGATATLVSLHDGSSANRMALTLDAVATEAAFTVVSAGGTVADLSAAGVSGETEAACAAAFAADDFALSLNGAAVVPDTGGSVPAVTTLSVGAAADGTVGPRCWVRRIGLFPRRMDDALLRQLGS